MPYDEGSREDFTLLSTHSLTDSLTDAQDDSISELCSSLKMLPVTSTTGKKILYQISCAQMKAGTDGESKKPLQSGS